MGDAGTASGRRRSRGIYAAIIAGMLGWLAVCFYSGKLEAWDTPLYFHTALPLLALFSGGLAYREPARAWRFGLAPALGQAMAMFIMNPSGSLLPLGLVTLALLSLPGLAAAWLGAWLSRRT